MTTSQNSILADEKEYVENRPVKVEILPIPVPYNVALEEIVVPALQAWRTSPYWDVLPTRNSVIYVWGDGEGIVDPESKTLFYVTRRTKKILLVKLPKITPLLKEPSNTWYSQFNTITCIADLLFTSIINKTISEYISNDSDMKAEIKYSGVSTDETITFTLELRKKKQSKIMEIVSVEVKIEIKAYYEHNYPVFSVKIYPNDNGFGKIEKEKYELFIDFVKKMFPKHRIKY